MSKLLAEECRKRAAECADTAREQQDPEIKREYSDLAATWRLIAMNSERRSPCSTTALKNERAPRGALFCSVQNDD